MEVYNFGPTRRPNPRARGNMVEIHRRARKLAEKYQRERDLDEKLDRIEKLLKEKEDER